MRAASGAGGPSSRATGVRPRGGSPVSKSWSTRPVWTRPAMTPPVVASPDRPMADLEQETTELLARLVRFRTVNPPGDERPLQEHLAGLLRDAGFEVELLGRTDGRPNLVARLRGAGDGPTLCLLSHVDTV